MTTFGFLHTSPVHVPTFRDLVRELAPDVHDIHVVDEELLARARAGEDVAIELDPLKDADVVVCTCSTIGPIAERQGENVIRVDRPMAREAARSTKVGVVVALESTIEPTLALLEEEGSQEITVGYAQDAWAFFEAGDLPGYYEAIARAASKLGDVDVVVLAQASMAPAAALIQRPALSSPRLAVQYAIRAAQQGNPGE